MRLRNGFKFHAATSRRRARRGCCQSERSAIYPSSLRRGGRDINKTLRSLPIWSGRGGDQIPQSLLGLNTTPSARAKDAPRLFLDRAATPPRRGGGNSPPTT